MFQDQLLQSWNSPNSLKKHTSMLYTPNTGNLSYISLFLYRYPEMFKTTSNEAYNVVKRQTGRGGVRGGGGGGESVEGEYENPQNLPPPTSSQPTTTAAGDSLYEPV